MATATDRTAQRGRLPLAWRIFLLLALLLSAAIISAVWITQQQGARVADRSVQRALDASSALQEELAESQLEEVKLKIALIAADPAFVKYIDDAQTSQLGFDGAADERSIQDLLTERAEAYGFDVGMVLNPAAEVLARTDRFEALQESLAEDRFVRSAIDPPAPILGYWRLDDQLYEAASWPLEQGGVLIGFLLIANQVDDRLGERIGQVSSADIAFLLPMEDRIEIIGSSLEESTREMLASGIEQDMGGLATAVRDGRAESRVRLELGGQQWIGRLKPLDSNGGPEIGAALQLTSVTEAAAGYRSIVNVVGLAGLLTLLIALPLSFLLAKASLRPLTRMAAAAKSAAAGDYRARLEMGGNDELAELAGAFDSLLSDLRGERDIESYVTQLSKLMPDPSDDSGAPRDAAPAEAMIVDPERQRVLLIGVENRALSAAIELRTPIEATQEIDAWGQRLAQRAQLYGGRVVMFSGTRVLAAFKDGDDDARYEALGWLDSVWTTSPDAAAGFASGDVLLATSDLSGSPFPVAVGLPTRQVDALLAECPGGCVLLSRAMGLALNRQMPEGSVTHIKGVRSGGNFYGVSGAALRERLPIDHQFTGKPAYDTPTVLRSTPELAHTRPRGAAAGDSSLRVGAEFDGRYRILSELGKGGMGVVYKARDLDLDDIVAIKTLLPSATMNQEQLERLKSELKLARKITHPNVLRTFDFGEFRGSAYISMEYVRGMTLRQLIGQAGRVPYTAALRIARQLCAGLAAAHEVGVLHRDIKPENLILEASGNAKLMDFGIARPIRRSGPGHTEAGTFVGTPHYSAPEQLAGEEVDHRCDIYAVGVLMCEMFSGQLPYQGSSTVDIYAAQLQGPPTPPSDGWPEIPAELESLILRCIKRDRNERFADVASLAEELERLRA